MATTQITLSPRDREILVELLHDPLGLDADELRERLPVGEHPEHALDTLAAAGLIEYDGNDWTPVLNESTMPTLRDLGLAEQVYLNHLPVDEFDRLVDVLYGDLPEGMELICPQTGWRRSPKQPHKAPSIRRGKIFGCSPTAVIRTVAAHEEEIFGGRITGQDVVRAMVELGFEVRLATAQAQLSRGRSGELKPAKLSPEQLDEVVEAIREVREVA